MHFIPEDFWKIQKDIMEYYHIFVVHHMGLNIPPSIWQSYINAILECLQSRKYCEAIMDDLLLFISSKKSHIAK